MITRTSYVKITSWVDENTLEPFTTEEKIKYPFKQLSDEEIEKVRVTIMETAYWCADENMPEAYNAVKVCCSEVLAIIKASRGKE